MLLQVLFQWRGHFRVHRRHELRTGLEQRDIQTEMTEVFGHFEPDEASTSHDGLFGTFLRNPAANLPRVRNAPHAENARQIDAWQLRPDRSCSRREHEHVVGILTRLASEQVLHRDLLGRAVDGCHLVMHLHRDTKPAVEELW